MVGACRTRKWPCVFPSAALENSLANYDYTAIMAMPYMENAPDPKAFYRELVDMAVHGQFVDSGKAIRELGFAPRLLGATLSDSVDWYRRNGYIPQLREGDNHGGRSQAGV